MVLPVEIKRCDPQDPDPPPTQGADGTGWLVSCPTCGKTRTVHREQIMSGAWAHCLHCEAPPSAGNED